MTLARYAYFAGAQRVDSYGLPVAGTITAVRLEASPVSRPVILVKFSVKATALITAGR